MKTLVREPALGLTVLALTGLMALFIVFPQVQVVLVPGLAGYEAFFREGPNWVRATQNSLTVMVLSTTTAVTLGFAYAYAMVYSRMPWKPFFRLIAVLPMLSPPFVVAASYILLFGPRGLITYGVFGQSPNILGLYGLWGVQTIAYFPYAYLLIADVLGRSDPRLEQAARNLGASPWAVFRTVTLPLARPGLAGAVLLVAIYVLEDFGNPALIAGQYTVLPTLAYGLISGFGDFAGGAVVSTILLSLAMALFVLRIRLEGRRGYVTISGRGSSMPRPPVPPPVTWVCFSLSLVLAGLILLVYGVLVLSALVEAYPFNFAPTLKHFAYVGAHFTSLRNSLVYAVSAAALCSAFRAAAGVRRAAQRMERSAAGRLHRNRPGRRARHLLRHRLRHSLQSALARLARSRRADHDQHDLLEHPDRLPRGRRRPAAGRSFDRRGRHQPRRGQPAHLPRHPLPAAARAVHNRVRDRLRACDHNLSVVIFLFTPPTTVATITIFQLVNDFNWGGATAFTVSVIGMAIAVLVIARAVGGRRVDLGEMARG